MAQINNKLQDKHTNSVYLFDKALLLKTSLRARNRAKAEKIFNLLLEDKDLDYELTIRTLLNLCELHLIELQITNDAEVLDDINPLISRLLKNAEKSHSYWVLSETYLLQAKLSLLILDVKKTQQFLTQAQMVAESHGLRRLAMQISHEHDEVINKLDMWKKLKESDSTYSERMMLTGLNEQMEGMVRKRIIEFPEFSDEEPILLLILSEGGRPFFSQSFVEDKAFESHIFGGFLTTIDYFIREMFSEGLDRASFGEYTLLMKSLTPFFICYIFRGDSYHATQKIKNFMENIHKKDEIWQKLLESFQGSKSVHLNDIPLLNSLIKETFIPKK